MLQTLLYRLTVHLPAAGKGNIVPQCNNPGPVIHIFKPCSQPGLHLHGIRIAKQGFSHTIADAGPAGIGMVRVYIRLLIFRIERGVAKYKDLFFFLCCRLLRAAAACQNTKT